MPGPTTSAPSKGAVVFLHAHPDDEAIFTGGTLRLLADAGWRTVVVFATGGELGAPPRPAEGEATAGPDEVADVRADESQVAAVELGVAKVHFLDFADSGLPTGHGFVPAPGSLAAAPLDEVTDRVAEILVEEQAETVVTYDAHGIYGHPDHIVVHRAGVLAAGRCGLLTRYEATVDREYLHFVETHLVEEAHAAGATPASLLGTGGSVNDLRPTEPGEGDHDQGVARLGLAASGFGTPTVLVDLALDVAAALPTKRAAMAAHASQIPPTSSALLLDSHAFAEVYGLEWYLRFGPPGALDTLA